MRLLGDWSAEIPDFVPEDLDPVYQAEIARYDRIAQAGPEAYAGHAQTHPEWRAKMVKRWLDLARPFLEIGPGFGELLRITEGERYAVDLSRAMLERLRDIPGVRLARALADNLPFEDVPQIVADSVFQTVPCRERFLCEVARALAPGGRFIFSIAYRWNYPRRPQQGFDVRKEKGRRLLRRYLKELGLEPVVCWDYLSLSGRYWSDDIQDCDILYIGVKKGG